MGLIDFKFDFKSLFTKQNFQYILIIGLGLWIVFMKSCGESNNDSDKDALMKEILRLDKTVQESNGSYKKLVDNYNSQKDLMNEVKDFNKDLAKTIKKNDEKLLMVTNAVISFDNKLDNGITVKIGKDSVTGEKTFSFVSRYPSGDKPNDEWFVQYDGKFYEQQQKVDGKWTFNKLKFNVILTEQENGMWATRIDGPDFMKVDSIKVNSLPKSDYNKVPKFHLLLGAGYRTLMNLKSTGAITLSGGFEYKTNMVLVDVATNEQIGVTFIRKFGKK